MSCCGNQRAAFRNGPVQAAVGVSRSWAASGSAEFEYLGAGQLTVTGPLTGSVYRFTRAQRVRVHGSDVPSLVSVPGLRLVH